jgi:glycosyltransferase involved in cell wall biosynthesis
MAPPSLLFLCRSLGVGGAERQLVELAKSLHGAGWPVSVLLFYPGGQFEADLERAGIQVQSLRKRGRWDVFPFLWRLHKAVRRMRPDLIHGYLPVANLLALAVSTPACIPRVVWGVRASYVDFSQYDFLSALAFRLECRFSRWADLIITNSRAGRDYHVEHGFPARKMVVIPNGIDTDRFRPDEEARCRVRAEWGIQAGEMAIGLVGRLDPMKDYPNFLRAAALFDSKGSRVHFVCVGDGPEPYKAELRALQGELGLTECTIWTGAKSNMPAVYNALDVLCSASLWGEGFSNVIGEAMACGVPCVVTDVGDSAWIVGQTGEVVPPADPARLADGMKKVLERLAVGDLADASRRAEVIRGRVVSMFSLQKLLLATEQALRGLAE